MSELEIRMYAIARTQIHPSVRIRWRGIGPCDWRNDLWPALFAIEANVTMEIPGQAIKGDSNE